jgi:ribosomal-protein-alanine N-acetyltransferase
MSDIPQIERIERSSFTDAYPKSLLVALASLNPETFLVAVSDDRVVGYVSAMVRVGRSAHLVSIAVHPDYRQLKIAKSLTARLIELLRRMRVESLQLEVRESNNAAKNLYRAFGFQHVRTVNGYYDDGEAATVMRLSL